MPAVDEDAYMLLLVVGRVQSGHMEGWTDGRMMVRPNKLNWPLLVSSDDAHLHVKANSPGLACLHDDDAHLLSCLHDDAHLLSCLHDDTHLHAKAKLTWPLLSPR